MGEEYEEDNEEDLTDLPGVDASNTEIIESDLSGPSASYNEVAGAGIQVSSQKNADVNVMDNQQRIRKISQSSVISIQQVGSEDQNLKTPRVSSFDLESKIGRVDKRQKERRGLRNTRGSFLAKVGESMKDLMMARRSKFAEHIRNKFAPWHEVLAVDSVEAKALENDFLQLYRCCHIKQTRAAHAMDDEFIRYRNTNLRHHLQITWAVTMLVWMLTTRAFDSVLVLGSNISRNQVDFIYDITCFSLGHRLSSFYLFMPKCTLRLESGSPCGSDRQSHRHTAV